ncbi:MAG: acetate--CoA ligase family protein, partial [Cycloclasticus sp.]|nr:acetate--CoA ligase family protein [Cycloclasticus sp.]
MKIISSDIAHKSEAGGVALNLVSAEEVRTAANLMFKTVAEREPNAKIEGLLISPMIADGVDFIIGTQCDPIMGPVIMVGLGGIYTEILKDVRLSLAPVTHERALSMLTSLRGAAIFQGARGQAPININAVADAVSRLSVLAVQNTDTIDSIEINPLRAMGDKVVALDALILNNEAKINH